MRNHCMVDLETLDSDIDGVILSIGAVAFDPFERELGKQLYTTININDSLAHGFTVSKSTIKWWSEQSIDAQSLLKEAKETDTTVRDALKEFSIFFKENDLKYLWGNGAAFDNTMLSRAYTRVGMCAPWKYWDDLCFRTVKTLNPNVVEDERLGTYHNALDDAIHQTKHCQKMFNS